MWHSGLPPAAHLLSCASYNSLLACVFCTAYRVASCRVSSRCVCERDSSAVLSFIPVPHATGISVTLPVSLRMARYCSNCKDHVQATKQLALWSVSPILVLHLKRFEHRNVLWRDKVTGIACACVRACVCVLRMSVLCGIGISARGSRSMTGVRVPRECGPLVQRLRFVTRMAVFAQVNTLVEYPLVGLDMSRYVLNRGGESASRRCVLNIHQPAWRFSARRDCVAALHNGLLLRCVGCCPCSPCVADWRVLCRRAAESGEPLLYDLYGVVNHFGSMGFGHYTAFTNHAVARGFVDVDGRYWHQYDDSSVSSIPPSEVLSRSAYVLFYRRRSPTAVPIH